MKIANLATWIALRGTLIAVIKAIDTMLLEAYGWTPRGSSAQLTKRVE